MKHSHLFLWAWCKALAIVGATVVVLSRLATAYSAENMPWYDIVLAVLGITVVSFAGSWYAAKASPRLAPIAIIMLIAIPLSWAVISGITEDGDGERTSSVVTLYWVCAGIAIVVYQSERDREKNRTLADAVKDIYWNLDRFEKAAIYSQEKPETILRLQQAISSLFPLTGMHSSEPIEPQSLERIQERLDEARQKKEKVKLGKAATD